MSVKVNQPRRQSPNLEAMAQGIQTRSDFVAFVQALQASIENDSLSWENADLSAYLGAVAAWSHDMEGYFANRSEAVPDQPSWKLLGQILLAARVYE